jgi:hypothetical protein
VADARLRGPIDRMTIVLLQRMSPVMADIVAKVFLYW